MSRHARHDDRLLSRKPRAIGGRRAGSNDPFTLDRRREVRHDAQGSLRASYTGSGRFGITHLDLVDRSPSGMQATTRTMIERGSNLMICPEGSTIPWLSAKVVRCEQGPEGFVLGMKYTGPATAA